MRNDGRSKTSDAALIPGLLRHWAEERPDAPSLLAPGARPLSYGRLYEQTSRVAARLRAIGIRPEDRVAIVHPHGPELAAAFLAVSSAAVAAPLNPAYRMSELDFYLSDLQVRAIVVARPASSQLRLLAERRRARLVEIEPVESAEAGVFRLARGRWRRSGHVAPGETALVLHTSGTTARPKLVPLTHDRLCLSARSVARSLELTEDDRCLNVMPLFHIHGLVGALLSSLSVGASVVCAPGFHAPSFHAWLAELEPTWYTAVPTMHQAILARMPPAGATTSLRFIRSSSASLPERVHRSLERAFGVPVIEAYGMTEAAHQIASNPLPPGERKPRSVGVPTGVEITVLGEGEVGEVAIRGDTVFDGYAANPEANAEAFVDGWFRTGDEGSIDEDGYLFLRGRTKEIVNRGGEKVSPAEVEDALLGHPDVEQAASFAVPDERLGEDVGAAVVVREGSSVTERELQERVAEQLADFKVPSTVRIVREIPKGPTGKLQRLGLAERLGITGSRAAVAAAYSAPSTAMEREMAALWESTLDVERVGADDDFFTLGGDSILAAELFAAIASRYGRTLPLTMLMWTPTLRTFCAAFEEGSWDEDASIVPVQAGGTRPPLFVAHGLADEIFNVAALKRTLGDDQPLYAVRARLDRPGHDTVEQLAAEYLREIRALHPAGPYLFASMCSGVAVVMELSRAALAEGQDVRLAAVIDPRDEFGPHGLAGFARRAAEHARGGTFWWAVGRRLHEWRVQLGGSSSPAEAIAQSMAGLRRRYRLRRLPATLTVISTMDYDVPREFWTKLAHDVRWYEVPTPHVTIFQQPHADVLGRTFAEALEEAVT
ncbi:MAG TPA: AMP-binding protein [Gaiellaceae bacterium]|nr:AMP-binding protein [Gaiellaceae bacterium]